MKISVSILTYCRPKLLKELLLSLHDIKNNDIEILVVDNSTDQETERLLYSEFPTIRYFHMKENIGVVGRNVGIQNATGDIVITLDDDVIGLDEKGVKNVLDIFSKRNDIGAVCFKVTDFVSGSICNWCHHYEKEEYHNREFLTDEITEGAVAFRKDIAIQAGLYPALFFISHEGVALLLRMLDLGFKTIYSPGVMVRHRTALEGRKTWRRYYFDTRNQLWLVARNFPVLPGLRYLSVGLAAMFLYSLRDGFVRYWFKGVLDGIRGLPQVLQDRTPYTPETARILREIASHRPGFLYMLKQRLFRKEIRL